MSLHATPSGSRGGPGFSVIQMILQFKGPEKTVLITDAISGAGMPDGGYELGGQGVIVKDGAVRLEDGTLAGSSLTLDQAVRNMAQYAGCSVRQAINMASLNPARAIGVADRKGSIEPGKDGDIILLTPPPALDVIDTYIGGKRVKRT